MAPFTHLSVDAQSRIRPCCMFYPTIYNEKYTKLNDIFIGNENKILRDKMLNGERIDGCNKCYIDETIGKKSYRQLFNERYLNEKNIQYPKIRELELALGNKCNLKCVTCNGYYSSAWEKEDILLSKILPRKITINKNIENINEEFLNFDTTHLNQIKILGGEPFLYDEYISFFEKLNHKNIVLFLVTNNTIFPNKKWIDNIKKFKSVKLNLSLDGVDELGEFVRYGMKMKRYLRNFSKWKSLNIPNMEIIPHVVIHSLNIFNIATTLNWIKKHFNSMPSYDFLDAPDYLNIKYLPNEIKDKSLLLIKNTILEKYFIEYYKNQNVNNDHCINLLKYINFLELRSELPKDVIEIKKIIKRNQ